MRHTTTTPDYGPNAAKTADIGLYMLFMAAFPLLFVLFQGSLAGMLGAVVQLTLFALALWCIWTGQRAHAVYTSADIARRPRIPFKLIGSLLIGALVLILAGLQFHSIAAPLGLGLTAASLSIITFGLDPLSDKGFCNPDHVARQCADALTHQASLELEEIVEDISELEDDDLFRQTHALRLAVERLVRAAAHDPQHLRELRKPLRRLLDILAAEADHLATDWQTDRHRFARLRYCAKLSTLGRAFEEKARKSGLVLGRDRFELEADLLLDRMERDTAA